MHDQANLMTAIEADCLPRATEDKPTDLPPVFLTFDKSPQTARAKAYADHLAGMILASEQRARRRKQADHNIFLKQVYALAAEIACHVLRADSRRLFFQRSGGALGNRTAYGPTFVTQKLAVVVDALIRLGLISQMLGYKAKGAKRGIASSILPTPAIEALISDYGLTLADFQTIKPRHSIVLKEAKRESGKGSKIAFAENAETARLRKEVDEINQWIAQADLRFDPKHNQSKPVDTQRVHLRRVFTGGSFQFHGRLYGGFWQELSKEQRRDGLTINGERVISLDYSNMMLRLAYGHAGAQLPVTPDLYAIPPFDRPDYREGIKAFVNALFFQRTTMRRVPNRIAKLFPEKLSLRDLKSAVVRYHHGIAHLLDTDIGHQLWINESNLIIEVLSRLRELQVVVLPVHDSIIVPVSGLTEGLTIMEDTCLELIGVQGQVKPEWSLEEIEAGLALG